MKNNFHISGWGKMFFALAIIFIFGCGRKYNNPQQPNSSNTERLRREISMRVNKEFVEEETEIIKEFISRKKWNMKTTGTGLWYMIYEHSKGEKAATGKIATLEYTLSLLDSTVCYSSAQLGQKSFQLGYGGVESGLEEGVLLLRVGDKARMIMQPHLAHGLIGDNDCIPPRAIILYDVELISVK